MMTMARHLWISSVLVAVGLACGAGGAEPQRGARDWEAERRRMVDAQLRARDIRSAGVLDAMLTVPRHLFVPEAQRAEAYNDSPLPIGHDQTISQPYIVAVHDTGAGRRARASRARGRNRIGLPGGGAQHARERRVHDRDRAAAGRTSTRNTFGPRL